MARTKNHGDDDHHDPPFTHSLALARTRDATVAFGDGYSALVQPIERRIAQYLQRNRYTPLIVDAPPVPFRGTTSQALHDEVTAIGVPFHLVLTDLCVPCFKVLFCFGTFYQINKIYQHDAACSWTGH